MNEIKYKQESFIQFEYFNFYVLFKILFQYLIDSILSLQFNNCV
jgi:hypothetical protein